MHGHARTRADTHGHGNTELTSPHETKKEPTEEARGHKEACASLGAFVEAPGGAGAVRGRCGRSPAVMLSAHPRLFI